MSTFSNSCNSDSSNLPKIMKFEGNTPVILQGSNYIFSSSDLSLRYWYSEITTYITQTDVITPNQTKELNFNFKILFLKVTPPSVTDIDPSPVLSISVQLYKVGSTTPDLIIPIDDVLFMTFDEEFEKFELINNSTGLTIDHSYSILLAK